MLAKIKGLWNNALTRDLILFTVLFVIVVVGGWQLFNWLNSRQDAKFDAAEKAKIAQIEQDAKDSAIHEEKARQQDAVIADLTQRLASINSAVVRSNVKIDTLRRNRQDAEKELQTGVDAANSDMDVKSRCLRVCDNAKVLGLIPATAACDCN